MLSLRVKAPKPGTYKLEVLRKKHEENTESESESSTGVTPKMMRVAIAGTGGLALLMAHFVNEDTSHQLVILSRSVSLATKPLFPLPLATLCDC